MGRLVILSVVASVMSACSTTPLPHSDDGGGSQHPFGTGSVEFVGFTPEELQAFRVIPEDGGELFAPRDGERIADVDGFWWKPTESFWFKIPDHCHSTISKVPHGLMSSPDCGKLGSRVQKLRGQPAKPGWQRDEGRTAHATDYPF